MVNLTEEEQKVVELLELETLPGKEEMAQRLGISKGALGKRLERMQKKGIIKGMGSATTGRYYEVVKDAQNDLSQVVSQAVASRKLPPSEVSYTPRQPMSQATTKLKLRLHRKMKAWMLLLPAKPELLSKLQPTDMANNMQYQGKGFRITTQHLIVEGIEIWAENDVPIAIIGAAAEGQADYRARFLARQYGLEVDWQTGASPAGLEEIELTEHPTAEVVKRKGIIPLHLDEAGNPDVWMDKSFGLGGLESNNPLYIQSISTFTSYLVEQFWSPELQLQLNDRFNREWAELHKFVQNHNDLTGQAAQLIAELRAERDKKPEKIGFFKRLFG